jgi:hypothetical protein
MRPHACLQSSERCHPHRDLEPLQKMNTVRSLLLCLKQLLNKFYEGSLGRLLIEHTLNLLELEMKWGLQKVPL